MLTDALNRMRLSARSYSRWDEWAGQATEIPFSLGTRRILVNLCATSVSSASLRYLFLTDKFTAEAQRTQS
jgi:hypothetical protein